MNLSSWRCAYSTFALPVVARDKTHSAGRGGFYARLTSLAGYIAGTDDRPTDQAREVFEMLGSELGDYQRQMMAIRDDIAAFNRLLDDRGIDPIALN